MKKLVCFLVMVVCILMANVSALETEIVYDQVIEGNQVNYYLKDSKVYVEGKNTYGQLALGLPIDSNDVAEIQEIKGLPEIASLEYNDYTIKMVDKNNSNIKYVAGKNSYIPTISYKNNYSNYFLKKNSNIAQRVTYNGSTIIELVCYKDKSLKTINTNTKASAKQIVTDKYGSNNKVSQRYVFNYSNNVVSNYFVSNYNTAGKIVNQTKYFFNSNLILKQKVYYTLLNNKLKHKNTTNFNAKGIKTTYLVNTYNNKATYVLKNNLYTYNNKGVTIKKLYKKYRSNKKLSYTWYGTYNNKGVRLGTTKKWYNKKGKLYKIDAVVEKIKYYSQKNGKWSGIKCSIPPYNGSIAENGCMMSSFAMINSKYYHKKVNPGQMLSYGLDCNFNYNKAAKVFGYNVQNTYPTRKYTRNANTSFYNSKKLVKNNKSTYKIKDAINRHQPVQVWLTPNKRLHRGHSVVAYRYVYNKGKWDIKIYDPYTPGTPRRSLRDLSTRHYIAKAQIWEKVE
ncbi:hypothetical protein OKW22_000996 [Bacilli bacterium PM5-3]|nr:hypothetical protein [Bacilli bacterium PM5-3]MDH6604235.1 hypothetical protein [Bacilli bacterium PM5-9]